MASTWNSSYEAGEARRTRAGSLRENPAAATRSTLPARARSLRRGRLAQDQRAHEAAPRPDSSGGRAMGRRARTENFGTLARAADQEALVFENRSELPDDLADAVSSLRRA